LAGIVFVTSVSTAKAWTAEPSSVEIVGAYIAPAKANGNPWDGTGKVDTAPLKQAVNLVIEGKTYREVTKFAMELAIDKIKPPDVKGTVEISTDGGSTWKQVQKLPKVKQSYEPAWSEGGFSVSGGDNLVVRISLVDVDAAFDDPIGKVLITSKQLRSAYAAGGDFTLGVATESKPEILFLTIRVR
jgi:hypothetical protein